MNIYAANQLRVLALILSISISWTLNAKLISPSLAPSMNCANVSVSSTNGAILVTGLDAAPITSVQIFTSAWATEFTCFADCNHPVLSQSVTPGAYFVFVKFYNTSYQPICETETVVIVTNQGQNDNETSNNEQENNAIDLEFSLSSSTSNVAPYTTFSVLGTISNTGSEAASNVIVNIPQPDNVVFQGGNAVSVSQGSYNPYTDLNWTIGNLAAGQTETITLNYFSLGSAPYTVYGQVNSALGTDSDSTPNNGNNTTANEDDEAVYNTNSGTNSISCPLDIEASVTNIRCYDNGTPDNAIDDIFNFDVMAVGGSLWGWTGGGSSGSFGQTVNFGPFEISNGMVDFTLVDNANANCFTTVSVNPPSTCSSSFDPTSDCNDISVSADMNTILVNSLAEETLTAIWIFDMNWQTVFSCSYECNASQEINVTEGTYNVIVKKLHEDWSVICEINQTLLVGDDGGTNNIDISFRRNNTFTNNTELKFEKNLEPENIGNTEFINAKKPDLKIFPNPATSLVNIKLEGMSSGQKVLCIHDQFGREIERRKLNNISSNSYLLQTSNYQPGVYLVSIRIANEVFKTKQLIILPH